MPAPLNILVVEDHDVLRSATVSWLAEQGHCVNGVVSAEEANDLSQSGFMPDIYVIDLNLPGEDGLSLARRLRASNSVTGLIMTTARSQIEDRVKGYKSGADIYLAKPVDPEELSAAIDSLGQRLKLSSENDHDIAVLNVEQCTLTGPAGVAQLTYSETVLLSTLKNLREEFLPRGDVGSLMGIVAGRNVETLLNVRLSQLRKKIHLVGVEGPIVKSLRGRGYRLCAELRLS